MHARDDGSEVDEPQLAIRRWGDGCFHSVEEEVPEGYIVDGILIARDDVVEVIQTRPGPPNCPGRPPGKG